MAINTKLLAATLTGPGPAVANETQAVNQLGKIISTIIGLLTIIAVIFFIIQIIFAGYGYMSAQGDEAKLKAARKRLTDNILGLTIVVIAYGVGAFFAKTLGLGDVFNLNTVFSSLTF